MHTPVDVQIIGQEVAIRWSDGAETFFPADRLRAASPSAETQGERDIFGRQYGGDGPRTFDGVSVLAWDRVGNYALRFMFSDGHQTGLYTYDYLRSPPGSRAHPELAGTVSFPPAMPFPARTTTPEIELGNTFQPKFGADGLIPCITQDAATGEILMFAFMNAESLEHTLRTRKATYWSRSRNKLWIKGEESGNVQRVQDLRTDCDQDVILLAVTQDGAANASCHNGFKSCFYRRLRDLDGAASRGDFSLETTAKPLFDPALVYKRKP